MALQLEEHLKLQRCCNHTGDIVQALLLSLSKKKALFRHQRGESRDGLGSARLLHNPAGLDDDLQNLSELVEWCEALPET